MFQSLRLTPQGIVLFGGHDYTIFQSITLQTIFSHDLFPDVAYNLSSLPISLFRSAYENTHTICIDFRLPGTATGGLC